MDFRPPLIADTQPAELVEPGYRTLHYPPVDAQSADMACKALCQDGLNSQGAQHPTMSPRVIGSVTLNPVWSAARPAPLATHRRNSCHQRQQLGHVMAVSFGQNGGQGEPIGVSNQVVLTARLAPVRGIGSCFSPHRQPLGRTRYPPGLETNQSGQPLAVWTAEVHEASAKPQLSPNREADASRSCPSRIPSPRVASARGCRSSARTIFQSALAGRSRAFDLDIAIGGAWASATRVGLVLPVAFPSASPSCQGKATANQAPRTRLNQFILLPVLNRFLNPHQLPCPRSGSSDLVDQDDEDEALAIEAGTVTFGLERDLQSALRGNIEELEMGLKITDGGSEQKVEAGWIDVTAEDVEGKLVVIELKTGAARPGSLTQILAYMASLESEKRKAVRGILIAGYFDRRVILAARRDPALQLRRYCFSFTFSEP